MVFKDRSHFLDMDDAHALLAKAEGFGIELEYVDARGQLTVADRDSVRRVIEAMSRGGKTSASCPRARQLTQKPRSPVRSTAFGDWRSNSMA